MTIQIPKGAGNMVMRGIKASFLPPVPSTVTNVAFSAITQTQAVLSFDPVADADSYEYSLDGVTWLPVPADHTLRSLTVFTVYAVQVRGINKVRKGQPGTAPLTTHDVAPAAIADLAAAISGLSGIALTYTVPARAVSLQYSLNGGVWTQIPTDKIIKDLAQGIYAVQVRSLNATGDASPVSNTVNVNLLTYPTAPTALTLTPLTPTTFTLQATPGANTVSMEYSLDGTQYVGFVGNKVDITTTTGAHVVAVRGVSSIGTRGTATVTGNITLETPIPATVTDLALAVRADVYVRLQFTVDPYTTYYEYSLNDGAYQRLPIGYTISGLTASTAYTIKIKGYNGRGAGTVSNTLSFTTTQPLPGALNFGGFFGTTYPFGAHAVIDRYDDDTYSGKYYAVEYTVDNGATWKPISQRILAQRDTVLIADLQPATTYSVAVRAVNGGGAGPASNYQTFTTTAQTTSYNPARTSSRLVLRNNNMSIRSMNTSSGWATTISKIGYKPSEGKRYAEFYYGMSNLRIALVPEDFDPEQVAEAPGVVDIYPLAGRVWNNGYEDQNGPYPVSNWIRMAWSGNAIWFGSATDSFSNWANNANPGYDPSGISTQYFNPNKKYHIALSVLDANPLIYTNFGDFQFKGAIPGGFTAWKGA